MFKFTSRKLVPNLERLKQQYTGKGVSARIRVEGDMDWWFYQEWGTAMHFGDDNTELPPSTTMSEIPASTHPNGYSISSEHGGIRLPGIGGGLERWVPHVGDPFTDMHPGVRPKAFIRMILADIHTKSVQQLASALIEGGFEIDYVKGSLLNEVMPSVLEAITESMAAQLSSLSDRDIPGKLGDTPPSVAFEAAARIVDTSSG